MANLNRAVSRPQRRFVLPQRFSSIGQTYGALAVLLLLVVYNLLFTPSFRTLAALNLNLTQVATTVIVATGMTLVIATGGIDLSVGSLMAIAGALAPMLFLRNIPLLNTPVVGTLLAWLIPISVAGLFGLFNGLLITTFRIQPIIATLILYVGGRGIAQVVTSGNIQTFKNPSFQIIGLGRPFGIPVQVMLMLVIVVIVAWLIRATIFGRYVFAVGGNEAAARLAGVPVDQVKRMVYIISGLLAGLAGLIVIAINSSSDANRVGLNMELDAIAAVAVGGTPLTGGRATVIGTLIGALIIQLIRSTLLSKGVSYAVAQIIVAAIILLAVYAQRQRKA